jgi:F-type H+-transporting ATPase subunit c
MLAAVGQGRVTGSALTGIAEQPGARDSISTALFISLALLESLALYALIVALILLFANPLLTQMLAS